MVKHAIAFKVNKRKDRRKMRENKKKGTIKEGIE